LLDYQIQPNTRRCSVTGRELKPGEPVYSILTEKDGKFVRQDFAPEMWQGPPPEAFSFWAGRVPTAEAKRKLVIDDELLLDCFERLQDQLEPGKVAFRYVIALLLMRRRKLKFEQARAEGGQEVLELRCTRTGATHAVTNPGLSDDEVIAVQQDVFQALGWE